MHRPMRLGVMVTLDDHRDLSDLDVDFFELLVRERDTASEVERFLDRTDREMLLHAPERMRVEGELRLIDLAEENPYLREAFIDRIQEVASIASRYDTAVVVHPGGVHQHPADPEHLLRNLASSLGSIEGPMWMENMPRRYHLGEELWWCSLLKRPEEFDDLLPYLDGVTLDISHAYLSVERGGNTAIASFFEHLRGHIRHVHLSDAAQPHREGMQLGTGDVDLSLLPRMKGLPVLLEVWGGHLDQGRGFREALRLARTAEGWFKGCIATPPGPP